MGIWDGIKTEVFSRGKRAKVPLSKKHWRDIWELGHSLHRIAFDLRDGRLDKESAAQEVDQAFKAVNLGASDYLPRPRSQE